MKICIERVVIRVAPMASVVSVLATQWAPASLPTREFPQDFCVGLWNCCVVRSDWSCSSCSCPRSPQSQADCGHVICWSCDCKQISFLLFGHAAPGAQFWFWSRLCWGTSLWHVLPTQTREGWKQWLIGAHLLSWSGGSEGYCRHSWNMWGVPAAVEAHRKQLESRHAPLWGQGLQQRLTSCL